MKRETTIQVPLRLPKAIVEKIDQMARELLCARNQMAKILILEAIKSREEE